MVPRHGRRPAPARHWRSLPAAHRGGDGTTVVVGAISPTPRRVTDDCARSWAVHEIRSPRGDDPSGRPAAIGLLFCCDVPGPIPERRRAWRPLAQLSDGELLELLERVDY